MIRITAKRHGFRRCGIAHPGQPTDYADERFSAEELARLEAEPMLLVEHLPGSSDDAPREELVAAIEQLPSDGWTGGGKPKTEDLARAAGVDGVSAAERDAAFAAYQERQG